MRLWTLPWPILGACLLGCAAIAIAGPGYWLPWGGWIRTHLTAWWALPLIASGLLALAAVCLPAASTLPPGREPARGPVLWPTVHRAGAVTLGLGLLLLLEPLLHLAVLAYLAHAAAPGAEDILLPGAAGLPPGALAMRILVLCIVAPMAEELFFRGRLLPWLAERIGPLPALSLTSLFFAIAHGSPIACLVAAPIGVLLGWLRLHQRDLGACVLVHQAHNGLFLLAGPVLVTAPLSAAVLTIGGALMLVLAVLHGRPGWRMLPAGLALGAALAMVFPPVLALKDRWWAAGTARLAARQRLDPAILVERLDAQRRRGRLTRARADLLRLAVADRSNPAARAVRLWLDASAATAPDAEAAAADLAAAALVPVPPPDLAAGAAAIGLLWPTALAEQAADDPALVATWLGPDGAALALGQCAGRDRKLLLSALERAWPGRLGTVLLALPPEAVTPLDRRHLRQHYPDAEAMIRGLDAQRQAAWATPP